MDINNTVALVTGAGSGMGAATAKMLAAEGAKVVLLDNNLETAQKIAEEIDGVAVSCDVSSAADAEAAVSQAVKLGELRICVNCAGIISGTRVLGKEQVFPLDEFQKVININLVGTFNILRLAAKAMSATQAQRHNSRGVIINTASIAAFEGQIGQAAYSASKGGVIAMTLPIARELARFGIRVMAIAPGLVETPMLMGMTDKVRDALADGIPFPKRFAKPAEFAQLVKAIIHNDVLNGEVIRMDGGLRLA